MPFGITKIMSALLKRKWLLCKALIPVRVHMYGRRTGIPSGLAPGAQSFQTGSPSSGGFHPFRLGWIGRQSFPQTFIRFWKADPLAKMKKGPQSGSYEPNCGSSSYFNLLYCSSSTGSSHSTLASLPGTSMARCWNQLSAAAPCQCLTPAGIFTTSPGCSSRGSLPHS